MPTPAATQASDLEAAPKRSDFPAGLGGEAKYQQALRSYKAKNPAKPTPAPAATPSPKAGSYTTETSMMKDTSTGGYNPVSNLKSTTPTKDAQEKAKRFETLDDDTLSSKAKGGDFEAKAEAQKRFKKGNMKFKDYEHYGE